MSVTVNDAALADFLRSSFGPVGRDLARRVENVSTLAYANASGPVIDVRTEDLRNSIRGRLDQGRDGLEGVVGSDARHRGYLYPAFVARAGETPGGWLIEALRDGFRGP